MKGLKNQLSNLWNTKSSSVHNPPSLKNVTNHNHCNNFNRIHTSPKSQIIHIYRGFIKYTIKKVLNFMGDMYSWIILDEGLKYKKNSYFSYNPKLWRSNKTKELSPLTDSMGKVYPSMKSHIIRSENPRLKAWRWWTVSFFV